MAKPLRLKKYESRGTVHLSNIIYTKIEKYLFRLGRKCGLSYVEFEPLYIILGKGGMPNIIDHLIV